MFRAISWYQMGIAHVPEGRRVFASADGSPEPENGCVYEK